MTICQHCGNQIGNDANFCPNCGQKIPAEMKNAQTTPTSMTMSQQLPQQGVEPSQTPPISYPRPAPSQNTKPKWYFY